MIQSLIDASTKNPRRLLLIDGLGALLSAFLLGVVLTRFEPFFGMPKQALYILATFPCLFAAYDFRIYFGKGKKWSSYLKIIAIANALYCLLSIGYLMQHYPQLTVWGWIYFLGELLIVITLAQIEYQTSRAWKT